MSGTVLPVKAAYDLVAPHWESWHWSEFWRLNEAPLVAHWLHSMEPGLGLDAGSGTGHHAFCISRQLHRMIAVDLSIGMLMLQRRKRSRCASGELVQADLSALPFSQGQFKWVLCTRVLSHASDPEKIVRELARVLNPRGECLLSDIHPKHPYKHTSVNTLKGRVDIESHKHSLDHLLDLLGSASGFELTEFLEFRVADLLWKPPAKGFEKIYDAPEVPIFYLSRLKRL